MSRDSSKVTVVVDGRELALSNLEKVLYPAAGFTKAQVIDYYTRIAPVALPHLHRRPFTFKRYPNGVDAAFFFEKNAPSHRPRWLHTTLIPTPGSTKGHERIRFALLDDLPSLVWAANLATLELHTPMWRVDDGGHPLPPDLVVFDLDPGPGTDIVDCCAVALRLRPVLAGIGLRPVAKTSGSKGLQVYAATRDGFPADADSGVTSHFARTVAQELERQTPDQVVSNMKKDLRVGKVLVDWSQNSAAKTTVCVYSLRAREQPTVSTPVTWDEVEACAAGRLPLVFRAGDVVERVERLGDLFAPLLAGAAAG